MRTDDLKTLVSINAALHSPDVEKNVQHAYITNPANEVETSLASFLKHRLSKLQEATAFEDQIKEAITARLSEASFTQLIGLLEVVQKNNNIATEKILAPFIAQAGSKTVTETMREAERLADNSEVKVYNDVNDKAILQSLSALSQFLELAAKTSLPDQTADTPS